MLHCNMKMFKSFVHYSPKFHHKLPRVKDNLHAVFPSFHIYLPIKIITSEEFHIVHFINSTAVRFSVSASAFTSNFCPIYTTFLCVLWGGSYAVRTFDAPLTIFCHLLTGSETTSQSGQAAPRSLEKVDFPTAKNLKHTGTVATLGVANTQYLEDGSYQCSPQ